MGIFCKCYLTLICSAALLGVRHPQVHVNMRKIYCLWAWGPFSPGVRGWLTEYVLGWSVCVCVCVCAWVAWGSMWARTHTSGTLNMCVWVRERVCVSVGDLRFVCAYGRLMLVQKKVNFQQTYVFHCEHRCVRLYIFALTWKRGSRGYCGALGWSRVNSSLTPIHYRPLLPPSWCSALRHSQPPSFTHNVNHSGWTHRHRGGAEPASRLVRNTTCAFVVFYVRVCVHVQGCC